MLLVGALAALLIGVLVVGSVARGLGRHGELQRAADLGALAGARAMHDAYPRLFSTDVRSRLPKDAYLELGAEAATRVAHLNGATDVDVTFPDARSFAPVRIRVTAHGVAQVDRDSEHRRVPLKASAEATLAPGTDPLSTTNGGGGYPGPFAERQGQRMRPDVALAFDRLAASARRAGLHLIINSAFRSDAEQAILFARHPDPRWVAPPGKSLHRLGTELDLGPPAAYAWLAGHARDFHFVQRYSWEAWHYGRRVT